MLNHVLPPKQLVPVLTPPHIIGDRSRARLIYSHPNYRSSPDHLPRSRHWRYLDVLRSTTRECTSCICPIQRTKRHTPNLQPAATALTNLWATTSCPLLSALLHSTGVATRRQCESFREQWNEFEHARHGAAKCATTARSQQLPIPTTARRCTRGDTTSLAYSTNFPPPSVEWQATPATSATAASPASAPTNPATAAASSSAPATAPATSK